MDHAVISVTSTLSPDISFQEEVSTTNTSVIASVIAEEDHGSMSIADAVETIVQHDGKEGATRTVPNNITTGVEAPPTLPPGSPASKTRSRRKTNLPTVTIHGANWYKNDIPMNGPMMETDFIIKTLIGENITRNSDRNNRWSHLEYFLFMIPPKQLNLSVSKTKQQLEKYGIEETTKGEILKFFGVCILITRFEFGRRLSLWAAAAAPSKYVPAAALGKTGMSRNRFDQLWKLIRFSQQPEERPEGMSSGSYRRRLIDDYIRIFNEHHENMFILSSRICADEFISKWYGFGGD